LSGDYFVEVIEDINNSATWNGSSFWNSQSPERVFRSEKYSIKPNWENEYQVKVQFDKKQLPTQIMNILDIISLPPKSNNTSTSNQESFNTMSSPQISTGLNKRSE
jgi:hypothetical protein